VIDDVPVNTLGNRVELHTFRLIDCIEQRRKRIAQIETATTAVANVEDALKLFEELGLVIEFVGLPVK
jgi:hypothetical protein